MSSPESVTLFRWILRPSRFLAAAMAVFYGTAIMLVMVYAMAGGWKAVIVAAIVVSFSLAWRRHAMLRGRWAVTELRCYGELWTLRAADAKEHTAELLGTTFVHPWLVVLNFRVDGKRAMWPVLVLPDNVDSDAFRQLIVRLRRMPVASRNA